MESYTYIRKANKYRDGSDGFLYINHWGTGFQYLIFNKMLTPGVKEVEGKQITIQRSITTLDSDGKVLHHDDRILVQLDGIPVRHYGDIKYNPNNEIDHEWEVVLDQDMMTPFHKDSLSNLLKQKYKIYKA